jgi:chlorite dismutase
LTAKVPHPLNDDLPYWAEDSVYLDMDTVHFLEDLLHEANPKYDAYDRTEYYQSQMDSLIWLLEKRIEEMKQGTYTCEDYSGSYYDKNRQKIGDYTVPWKQEYLENRVAIVEGFQTLVVWLREGKAPVTVIGV